MMDAPPETKAWYKFDNEPRAQGYNAVGMGNGAMVMSNIFLSSSILYLASKQAGCLDEENDEVLDNCDGTVFGFRPASFVSSIAVISGVLSALFMPVVGAMIDYTDHRRTVGMASAFLMICIQVVQVGTVSSTWFAMAILQAITGFFFQIQYVAVYAYLPDMAHIIGEQIMTKYTARFVLLMFATQATFLVMVIAGSLAFGFGDVQTAQVSQGVDSVLSGVLFYYGWKILPSVPSRHLLDGGRSLFTEGFVQVYRTIIKINADYARGLRWYFLAVAFSESAANAFLVLAVVYLDEQIGLKATEIGILFLLTLLASLPGCLLGAHVTSRLDPILSWQLNMLCLALWSAGGAIVVDMLPQWSAYLWGVGIGVLLGWFYSTENLYFSMCLPKGQETELSGFFVYCTQILAWLPPLIFTIMVEADVRKTYGVLVVSTFFLIALAMLRFSASWRDVLKESGRDEEKHDCMDHVMEDSCN